jgi:site-specific DNA-methyltransferase (adenine-specific)
MIEIQNQLEIKPEVGNSTKPLLPAVPSSEVYLEDCVTALKRYADNHFDLAIVDPPYGLGDKLTSGGTWSVKWQDKGADWDKTPSKEYWEQLFRVSKNWIVFGGNYFIEHLPNCRSFIAWHKPYMDGMHSMSNVELALTSFDRNAKKISFNKDKGTDERIHVCQKPVQLYRWVLDNYAQPNDLILDTHLGSGSSRIAAYKGGFNFVGFEIDQEYYEKQEKRFNDFKSQLRLF